MHRMKKVVSAFCIVASLSACGTTVTEKFGERGRIERTETRLSSGAEASLSILGIIAVLIAAGIYLGPEDAEN